MNYLFSQMVGICFSIVDLKYSSFFLRQIFKCDDRLHPRPHCYTSRGSSHPDEFQCDYQGCKGKYKLIRYGFRAFRGPSLITSAKHQVWLKLIMVEHFFLRQSFNKNVFFIADMCLLSTVPVTTFLWPLC